jgi:hypothetical protein
MIQIETAADACTCVAMVGSATFAIELSITDIEIASQIASTDQ